MAVQRTVRFHLHDEYGKDFQPLREKKVFVKNAIRSLAKVSPTGNVRDIEFVVLVGGSALDFEVPTLVTDALSQYKIVAGRGNIRGCEGPRNAVATGLAMSCADVKETIMEGSNTVIDNRPSVKVFYDCDHLSEADFVSVLLGIEEEGIPYDVQAEHCSSVLDTFTPPHISELIDCKALIQNFEWHFLYQSCGISADFPEQLCLI